MIAGLDSSTQPSPAQAVGAKNAGVSLWSGYLQTQPNVGLYAPWSRQGFENARLCGSTPIAFCSGWDNPAACKALAAAWNVRLCLDVEGGIRGDGAWVQAWLDASGAGLYGNIAVHSHSAPFHILAAYPGFDPQATWDPRRLAPPGPTGWQWQGTHTEFGVGVDRAWLDDWFATSSLHGGVLDDTAQEEITMKVVVGQGGPAGYVDPSGANAAYVTNGVTKRYIGSTREMQEMLALCGQTAPTLMDQGTLDRIPRIAPVPQNDPSAPALNVSAVSQSAASGAAVDLKPVTDRLDKLEARVDGIFK